MRNDADDDLGDLPSLRAEPYGAGAPMVVTKRASTGGLWLVIALLCVALAGLGYWSQQQLNLMAQQLVATQDSFAHISEQAAGRIQAISGQVVATETAVTSESEQLKLRLKQFEQQLSAAERQQRQQLEQLDRLAQSTRSALATNQELSGELKAQAAKYESLNQAFSASQTTLKPLSEQLAQLSTEQKALARAQAESAGLKDQLKTLQTELATLRTASANSPRLNSLEQDVMVLKAQLENAPAQAPVQGQGTSLSEFDSYRAQVSRQLTTLNSQVANLQQQLNARPQPSP